MYWIITLAVFFLGVIGVSSSRDGYMVYHGAVLVSAGMAAFKLWRSRKEKVYFFLPSHRVRNSGNLFMLHSKICRSESRYCAQEPPSSPHP